jgi:putative ABC transport system permease protein
MRHSPAAYGLAARLARREVVRRPWRTLLVALLIALPVAGMTAAVVLFRTDSLTPQQEWRLHYGNTDALIPALESATPEATDSVPEVSELPAGSSSVTVNEVGAAGLLTTDGTRVRGHITDLSLVDPMTSDVVRIDEGRPPEVAGEVLVSPNVAATLGVHVGDTVHLERPVAQDITITGIGRLRAYLDERLIVVAPGTSLLGRTPDMTMTYVQLADDGARLDHALALSRVGELAPELSASTRTDSIPHTNTDEAIRWTWVIGGLVLTVVGIVIASAFAAGARRQLTMLGQLAANGAGPDVLRRALFLQGTWTGIAGTALGLVMGAIALAFVNPHLESLFQRDVGSYVVRPLDMVPIVVIGIGAATVAALIPARTTSRIPVLAALAGRRPLTRVPRWVTVSGFVAIVCGLALLGLAVLGGTNGGGPTDPDPGNDSVWAATAILGGMAVLLGACAIAPAYVSVLDHVAVRLSGPWRFAARSLARQRTRTGAVVSGLCAAGALAVGASALVLGAVGADRAAAASERTSDVDIVATSFSDEGNEVPVAPAESIIEEIHVTVPGLQRIDLKAIPVYQGRVAVLADAAALEVYDLDDTARRALDDVGAIRLEFDNGPQRDAPDSIRFSPDGPNVAVASFDYPPEQLGALPPVLVSPAKAAELGLDTGTAPGPVILRKDGDFTADELGAIDDIRDDAMRANDMVPVAGPRSDQVRKPMLLPGRSYTFVNHYDSSSSGPDPFVVEAILSGIALGFALVVVAVSLALSAAETRDERDVLAVVGAAPVTMRRTSAHKAVILTVLGGLLAIPVGFLPVIVFTRASGADGPLLVFPWRTAAVLLVAVPLVSSLFTAVASALALRIRPVRVSTMTFE